MLELTVGFYFIMLQICDKKLYKIFFIIELFWSDWAAFFLFRSYHFFFRPHFAAIWPSVNEIILHAFSACLEGVYQKTCRKFYEVFKVIMRREYVNTRWNLRWSCTLFPHPIFQSFDVGTSHSYFFIRKRQLSRIKF